MDLVDVCLDPATPLVRGTTWMNVFSPRADAYTMRFVPRPGGEERRCPGAPELAGTPGSALGGMDPRSNNPPLTDRPYDFTPDLSTLQGLPIHVWSTKSLTARWSLPDPGLLAAKIVQGEDDVLSGELTSRLDVPLADCWLAYGRWVYPLGTVEPGQTLELAPAGETVRSCSRV